MSTLGRQPDGTWRDIVYVHQSMIDGKPDWEYAEVWPDRPPQPWVTYRVLREEWDETTTPKTRRILEIEIVQ